MKNIYFVCILFWLAIPAFSQESENVLTNKNGVIILPQKGEISIGIDAVPFLNLLNDKGASPGFNFINNIPTISVKYFVSDRRAIKVDILANFSLTKDGNDNLTDYVQDLVNNLGVNVGYEWRLGKTRVQGFYGVEGGAVLMKRKISTTNDDVYLDTHSIGFGINGFIGVEYFIAPKLSIGGQFGWGPSYVISNDNEDNTKHTSLILSADNLEGALILSFAF